LILSSSIDPRADPEAMCTLPVQGTVFVKHQTDCSKFFICHGLNGFMIECPAGTLWDENLNICNHAYQVSCNKEPIRNMKVRKTTVPTKPPRPAKAVEISKSNSVSDQDIKPNSIDDRRKVPLSTPVKMSITTTTTSTTTATTTTTRTTETTKKLPLDLPLCPSNDDSTIDLRSGEDYIPFETCLPACPPETESSIDLRGASDLIPGIDCIVVKEKGIILPLLPPCPSNDLSFVEYLDYSEKYIPFETCLPACPSESEIDIRGARNLIPGVNCLDGPMTTKTLPTVVPEKPLKLFLCPPEEGSSIDLRSGEDYIPFETCFPACPSESSSPINLRGADDLIPGIDCIPMCPLEEGSSIDLRSGEEFIPFETCLPACPIESDFIFGVDDLIPGLNCIIIEEKEGVPEIEVPASNDRGLPPCPPDDESPINLRSEDLIPGINCKVIEPKKETLPLCPSDNGSSINLRSGEEYIPYETCLPACLAKSDSTLDVRGADDLIPGIDCIEVEAEFEKEFDSPNFSSEQPYKLSLCPLEEESSINLRTGDENIYYQNCLPACLTESDSMINLRGADDLIPGIDCIPLCPSEEGSSIDLRSGEELVPFETCLPACPTENDPFVDLRSAEDLIPGVECIVVESKIEALPLCPPDDNGSPINLRSGGESIPYETCLPACPVESNSQVDLRGAEDLIPGVDCIVVEAKKEDLPLCPSDDGSTIDLRTAEELIPFETCLPACPTKRDSLPGIRGDEQLIPGVSCKQVRT